MHPPFGIPGSAPEIIKAINSWSLKQESQIKITMMFTGIITRGIHSTIVVMSHVHYSSAVYIYLLYGQFPPCTNCTVDHVKTLQYTDEDQINVMIKIQYNRDHMM